MITWNKNAFTGRIADLTMTIAKQTLRGVGVAVALSSMQVYAADQVTLKDVVERVVTTNPEVQAKYHTYRASIEDQNAAKGGFLPRADVVSTFRSQERLVPNVNNGETPNRLTQLVLKQMLFDGFATSSEVKRLDHASRVRYYELQSMMQNNALEAAKAYIDVLRYRQLVEYAQDNYAVHKQLYDRVAERVTAGVARGVDLEQAGGRLALAEANLLTETTNLQNVSARYQRVVGELPPKNMQAVDFLKNTIEPTANEALQVAYRQNPDLLSAIENIVASEQEVEGRKSKYWPRVDLQARKGVDVSNNGKNSTLAADALELTATFNLFNGFSDKSMIDQASQKLNASQDLRDKACIDTRQTLSIAYNDVLSLSEQLGYRNQHQLSIEKAREAYRKQLDIGQRSLLDLLDTENEYFIAKRTYTNTQNDLYTAYARTYASEGQLLSKLGVARGDLPDMGNPDYKNNYSTCQAIAPEMMKVDKIAVVSSAKPLSSAANDKMMANAPLKNAVACNAEVAARVNDWASAWRHKDYDNYMKFYSPQFQPALPLNHAGWEKQRRERLTTPQKINLELSNLQVTCDNDKAKAIFDQGYSQTLYTLDKSKIVNGCVACNAKRIATKGYQDQVRKELQFERGTGQWLILREIVNK